MWTDIVIGSNWVVRQCMVKVSRLCPFSTLVQFIVYWVVLALVETPGESSQQNAGSGLRDQWVHKLGYFRRQYPMHPIDIFSSSLRSGKSEFSALERLSVLYETKTLIPD